MKNTNVIATKNSPYGGRIKAGDSMKVSSAEARVLVLLGKARYAPKILKVKPKEEAKPEVKKQTYQRRDMVAAKPPVDFYFNQND